MAGEFAKFPQRKTAFILFLMREIGMPSQTYIRIKAYLAKGFEGKWIPNNKT
jgi:hypothetical protein